jgi:hypothetical protein
MFHEKSSTYELSQYSVKIVLQLPQLMILRSFRTEIQGKNTQDITVRASLHMKPDLNMIPIDSSLGTAASGRWVMGVDARVGAGIDAGEGG